ncbi:MAG: VTT domain-containing protein [Pirellulales bacterium]
MRVSAGSSWLARLAGHEAELTALRDRQQLLVYAGAFVAYTALAALLPVATGLTLAYGWFFGLAGGVLLVSFASTAAATLSMVTSRYLLRDACRRRFSRQLDRAAAAVDREGAFYLFALRLIPVFPFFVVNVVMGLTNIRIVTFWWVSQLGMLAGTVVYVFAGSRLPSLAKLAEDGPRGVLTPGLLVALALLGIFPLVAKRLVGSVRSRRRRPTDPAESPGVEPGVDDDVARASS